ncbi:sodium- and chloride-dependent neutral and basic amino acid transporter B(0+), partial [Trichonephila clavata]
FGEVETTISALIDEYSGFLQKRKTLFTAFTCILLFFLGLPCVTQGGIYVVQLMDWYSAAFSLMFFSLFETIAIAWVYDWSIAIGWSLAMCSIAPIPIVALWMLLKEKGNLKQRLINCLRPTSDWGPALEEHRILYRKSKTIVSSRFEQNRLERKTYTNRSLITDCDIQREVPLLQNESCM